MSLPRDYYPKYIADQLNVLAGIVKTRSRASLNDASHVLETISARFLNALFAWDLVSLNILRANYPAADLCDRSRRIAIQITSQEGGDKISHTAAKAVEHNLGADFDRLIVFFLLPKKPGFPRSFGQPPKGPTVETWDIADLLKQMLELDDLDALARAAKMLDEEIGLSGLDRGVAPASHSRRHSTDSHHAHLRASVDTTSSGITHFVHALLGARDWQDRPEFERLCEWWRRGGVGVNALVGIGGAGKTAIVERFLRILPGVLPEVPGVAKDTALRTPRGLFVFSFYNANPDSFFGRLSAWLKGEDFNETVRLPSYESTRELLSRTGMCLLVLDGLEMVQDDGARGGVFGEITDGRLRDLIGRLALGYLPGAAAVITTRFPIANLEEEQPPHYEMIAVEEIPVSAGMALLRRRGVKGPEKELERLVGDCGQHALTVDLAGGFIAEFASGDPNTRLELGSPDELAALVKQEPNARRRAVRKQQHRLARVAERYRQALADRDPATLALLERACLFRLGANASTLVAIFTGEGKVGISGLALASLSPPQLRVRLDRLVELRLLEATSVGQGESRYISHPAVRDGFLSGLEAGAARKCHEAVHQGLVVELGGIPEHGSPVADTQTLDILEEIIHHMIAAGAQREAWRIYTYSVRSYENIGKRLGDYARGERICRAFVGLGSPRELGQYQGFYFREYAFRGSYCSEDLDAISQWGLFLAHLGRLAEAAACHRFYIARKLKKDEDDDESTAQHHDASICSMNLAAVLRSSGRLREALTAAEAAVRLGDETDLNKELQHWVGGTRALADSIDHSRACARAERAHSRALLGDVDGALQDFREALVMNFGPDSEETLYSFSGLWHAALLARLGRGEEAKRVTERNIRAVQQINPTSSMLPECHLLLAELALDRGEYTAARELLDQVHDWALERDALELICQSALVRARIALAEGRGHATTPGAGTTARSAADWFIDCRDSVEEGLRIARDCGFGVIHIDLLVLRGQVALEENRASDAARDALVALNEGVHPARQSGLPCLLAATDSRCAYVWGEVEARLALAQACLLQAAQAIGQSVYDPDHLDALPAEVRSLILCARGELQACCEVGERIRHPRRPEAEDVLSRCLSGHLTRPPAPGADLHLPHVT